MKFSVTAKPNMPCVDEEFIVNGKKAEVSDFGLVYNHGTGNTNCCESMRFESIEPTNKVLRKYRINLEEYDEICSYLADKFTIGKCDICFKS